MRAKKDAVSFHDRFDPDLKQIVHPVGVVFASPEGVVSSYLLGVGYEPADLRLGTTRAAHGTIASAAMPVLLTGEQTIAEDIAIRRTARPLHDLCALRFGSES